MRHQTLSALAALAALTAAAGCGAGDDAGARPSSPVDVDVTDSGYVMPDRIAGGVVAMRFHNSGSQPHEVAMGRAEGGHTAAEVQAAATTSSGEEPDWLHDVGGPPLLTPGADITVTRTLEPGVYVILDGVPDATGTPGRSRGLVKTFTVSGESGASLPVPDAVVVAAKRRYVVPPLTAGTHTIELRNSSGSPRGFLLSSLNPGRTTADAERWIADLEGSGKLPAAAMPFTVLGAMQTIPSGTSVYVTVGLEAGRTYRLSDDESGIAAMFTPR